LNKYVLRLVLKSDSLMIQISERFPAA